MSHESKLGGKYAWFNGKMARDTVTLFFLDLTGGKRKRYFIRLTFTLKRASIDMSLSAKVCRAREMALMLLKLIL